MTRTFTSARRAVAESVDLALSLGVIITTVVLASAAYKKIHHLTPHNWSGEGRGMAAAIVGFVAFVVCHSAAQFALKKLRRLLGTRTTASSVVRAAAVSMPSGTPAAALERAESATATDAAILASRRACRLDRGEELLGDASRWCGRSDGEATLYLTDGVVLHFHLTQDEQAVFTLLSADSAKPVHITRLVQIRNILAAKVDALPNPQDQPTPVAV